MRVGEAALRLVARIAELTKAYGRYGYRRITALLHRAGSRVKHKKVERIWRREGLKVPRTQPKRSPLWWNHGSCIRKPPRLLPAGTRHGAMASLAEE